MGFQSIETVQYL